MDEGPYVVWVLLACAGTFVGCTLADLGELYLWGEAARALRRARRTARQAQLDQSSQSSQSDQPGPGNQAGE